jgi:putative N6-adenine-specific DNA methylase
MKFIAKTFKGLEDILAAELATIGAENIETVSRGCVFEGDKRTLYRANLELRTASRILVPIWASNVQREAHIYEDVQEINWSQYFGVEDTFAIDATVHSDYFTHSHYVALLTKDAIVDQFREKFGERPSIDTQHPTVRIHVYISDERFELSLDSSGDSLHKRGYDKRILAAPINDVLAAGLIKLSDWKMDCDFIDPMCGSGTLLIEAAMMAYKIPPLWKREHFGFQNWRNFDASLWEDVRKKASESMIFEFPHDIIGYDIDYDAVHTTLQNLKAAGLKGCVKVERKSMERQENVVRKSHILCNPPYDERLAIEDTIRFYALIGDVMKQHFKGSEAWIVTGNLAAAKHIGLRPSRKFSLNNGGLDCKFLKFELYEGSKKQKQGG